MSLSVQLIVTCDGPEWLNDKGTNYSHYVAYQTRAGNRNNKRAAEHIRSNSAGFTSVSGACKVIKTRLVRMEITRQTTYV